MTAIIHQDNPVAVAAAGGIAYFALPLDGVGSGATLEARFYYPVTITGEDESRVGLRYFNGTAWLPVRGSQGAAPLGDTADGLDDTTAGGRVAGVRVHLPGGDHHRELLVYGPPGQQRHRVVRGGRGRHHQTRAHVAVRGDGWRLRPSTGHW